MFQKCLILFVLYGLCACSPKVKTEADIINVIHNDKALQLQKDQCPVEVSSQAKDSEHDVSVDPDRNKRLVYHFNQCTQKASANSCYNLALGLQELTLTDEAEVMFQESCRLGIASGCTNRAAGIKNAGVNDEKTAQCVTKTFAKTCEWKDPWGCTMYANQLLNGEGVKQDTKMALSVLKGSCRYGEDDPACQNAYRIEAYIHEQSH